LCALSEKADVENLALYSRYMKKSKIEDILLLSCLSNAE
jgi:hypothetical protein